MKDFFTANSIFINTIILFLSMDTPTKILEYRMLFINVIVKDKIQASTRNTS